MSDASFYTTPQMSDDPAIATNQYTMDRWAKYLRESIWPVGIMRLSALKAPAQDWLFCQGQAVNRVQYSRLFSAIGITFGAGNGTTTFNLPDLRDAVPVGSSATNILGAVGGTATSGLPAHVHTGAAHTHTGPSHAHAQNVSAADGTGTGTLRTDYVADSTTAGIYAQGVNTGTAGTGATGSAGAAATTSTGTTTPTNYPPFQAVNYEIRAV